MRSIFLYVFILISCESKVDTHQSNMELLDDVVNIHDELMVKMKDLKSLKNELTQDGVESDNQLILELDNARSSMMKFMKKFSEDFQFDKYPMDRESYQDIDEKGLSIVNDKLKGQKKIVLEVSELFETSIANAEAAIKN
ncbi:MAG: hypothetical protein CNE34_02255 [Rhodothermaeota bacterium MED-G18]|nr:MAG: hypothetical protein CNE34_02255 [Rhodothermaeota bacterium MED-G18]